MDHQECHEISLKELPTREQKSKRNKDRRDTLTLYPNRLRSKSCTTPPYDVEYDRSLSDRSVSSSPDTGVLHLSPNSAFTTYTMFTAPPIESQPSPSPLARHVCNNFESSSTSLPYSDNTDPDQPLDMSTKCNKSYETNNSNNSYIQQQRPSVITCASALMRTQCSLSDTSHHVCRSSLPDSSSRDIDDCHHSSDEDEDSATKVSHRNGVWTSNRREIVSGSCDPVIDEHFRRSLGKDYQHIFSKSSENSISVTVDDHFAKALGDTWLQLQQSKMISPDSTESQSKNHRSTQQSQFQHSPELVSS